MAVTKFYKNSEDSNLNYSYTEMLQNEVTISSRELMNLSPEFNKYKMEIPDVANQTRHKYEQNEVAKTLHHEDFQFFGGFDIRSLEESDEKLWKYKYFLRRNDQETVTLRNWLLYRGTEKPEYKEKVIRNMTRILNIGILSCPCWFTEDEKIGIFTTKIFFQGKYQLRAYLIIKQT